MPLLKKDALKELRKRKVIIIRGRGGNDLHVIYTPLLFLNTTIQGMVKTNSGRFRVAGSSLGLKVEQLFLSIK